MARPLTVAVHPTTLPTQQQLSVLNSRDIMFVGRSSSRQPPAYVLLCLLVILSIPLHERTALIQGQETPTESPLPTASDSPLSSTTPPPPPRAEVIQSAAVATAPVFITAVFTVVLLLIRRRWVSDEERYQFLWLSGPVTKPVVGSSNASPEGSGGPQKTSLAVAAAASSAAASSFPPQFANKTIPARPTQSRGMVAAAAKVRYEAVRRGDATATAF